MGLSNLSTGKNDGSASAPCENTGHNATDDNGIVPKGAVDENAMVTHRGSDQMV